MSKSEIKISRLGCKILISGGKLVVGDTFTKTSYFMNIYFNEENDKVKEVREIATHKLPENSPCYGSFTCTYEDRMIRGGGLVLEKSVNTVLEFDDVRGWVSLPHMEEPRSFAGACLVENVIIVAGGIDSSYTPLTSMEMLTIDVGYNSEKWRTFTSPLPTYNIGIPLLNKLKEKLVLLEGNMDSYKDVSSVNGSDEITNRVWEGSWEGQLQPESDIIWQAVQPLKFKRSDFFSVVVEDNLYILGGVSDGLDRIDIYDGTHWKSGPILNKMLSTKNSQVVVDKRKRIIITTNFNEIVVYNTKTEKIEICEENSLLDKRQWYSASTN